MNDHLQFAINDSWIISKRSNKNAVDPEIPYSWFIEKEFSINGFAEDTATIFLTNRECPFHCLMCDLWKNTTSETVSTGMIPRQIEFALKHLSGSKHLKLYNGGSFFDINAIPYEDYDHIGSLVRNFDSVIVESHPAFIDEKCLHFRDAVGTRLEVAIGLEIADPTLLKKLNKHMDLKQFRNAVQFLIKNDILTRAFILLKPPFVNEEEGIEWAKRSIDFAFDSGVNCCTIIPVRANNGAMEFLEELNCYSPPLLHSLEKVLEYGLNLGRGRVFADTWDLKLFSICDECYEYRKERMINMNLYQTIQRNILCACSK